MSNGQTNVELSPRLTAIVQIFNPLATAARSLRASVQRERKDVTKTIAGQVGQRPRSRIGGNSRGVDGWIETGAGNVCTTVGVELLDPSKLGGAALCLVVITTDASGNVLEEEGCADAVRASAIDQRLWSASAGPLPVDLSTTVCEGKTCDFVYSKTVSFAANWQGEGNRQRVRERLHGDQPSCDEIVFITGWVRNANLTVSFKGKALIGHGNIQVLDGVSRCL